MVLPEVLEDTDEAFGAVHIVVVLLAVKVPEAELVDTAEVSAIDHIVAVVFVVEPEQVDTVIVVAVAVDTGVGLEEGIDQELVVEMGQYQMSYLPWPSSSSSSPLQYPQ